MNNIKIKLLSEKAIMPTRNNPNDAGLDLYATEQKFIPYGTTLLISTDIAIQIPEGYVGKIEGRSSMNKKGIITSGGVIDSGYSGDVSIILNNFSNRENFSSVEGGRGYLINKGDKIAQLLVYKVETPYPLKVETIWSSDRNDKGFGSSGR